MASQSAGTAAENESEATPKPRRTRTTKKTKTTKKKTTKRTATKADAEETSPSVSTAPATSDSKPSEGDAERMSSKATPENKPTAETSSSEPSAPPTPSGGGQNNQHQNGNTYTAPYGSSNRRKKRKKKRPGQQQQQQGGGMQRGNSGIPANVLPNEEDLRAEAAELDKIAGTKDYEKAAKDALNIADLQTMPLDELHELAEQQKIEEPSRKPRPELIFEILKAKAAGGDLMFGGGTLEVMAEGFGFLRQAEASYVASPDDIYVAPTIIRNMGLRQGMEIKGAIRPPKEGERFFALLRIDEVNKGEPARVKSLPVFEDLTPLHPEERFVLETEQEIIETRVVDLVAPIGKGQRALIVAPPRTGKTVLMQKITKAIHKNYPDVKIIVLLIDERPEEVTDFRRNTGEGVEVVASTFDEDAKRHIQVAEMVMSKARRYVEFGEDVVILLDSITRLARAYNAGSANTGKIMSGGIDSGALTRPKKFFGSARAIENGGSLTILGTALVDTGSKADEVIFEEFKGTGNSELHLDRKLIEKRIFPAIDVTASGTRREELLLDPKELELVYRLRKVLSDMNVVEAMELLKSRLSKSKTNAEFLITMNLG